MTLLVARLHRRPSDYLAQSMDSLLRVPHDTCHLFDVLELFNRLYNNLTFISLFLYCTARIN